MTFDPLDDDPLKPPEFHTFKVQLPNGLTIEKPIYPDIQELTSWLQGKALENTQLLGIPQHLLTDPTNYSSSSSDLHAHLRFMRAVDRTMRREQAVCLIWGQLLAAGFKGNLHNLALSFWTAHECFERSIEALAKHHRLGVWRFRRLA